MAALTLTLTQAQTLTLTLTVTRTRTRTLTRRAAVAAVAAGCREALSAREGAALTRQAAGLRAELQTARQHIQP